MKKSIAMITASVLLAATLSGCGGAKKGASEVKSDFPSGEISYPIENAQGQTIKFWKPLNGGVASVAVTENELQFTKWLLEETGINVEFVHPPTGQESEKFNLMLASGELPDIIQFELSNTSEGAETLVKNGYISELSEDFLKSYAPNFAKKLAEDSELDKSAKLNDGRYYGFSHWRSNDNMTVYAGPMIRKDWLDDLGLNAPETIEEWHNVLTRFKNEKGANAPLTVRSTAFMEAGLFAGAYGVKLDFFTNDGKVTHGVLEPGFRPFLETMSAWYREGLIDKDFSSNSKEQIDTKMLTGRSGATYGLIGSGMGNLLSAGQDEKYSLEAAMYPSLEKGGKSEFGYKDSKYYEPCYLISATCKNKELAARLLDYGYSEKGHMLYNFGREGISYKMVDGFPTFTELITNNPDGLSVTQALNMYTHCAYLGPTEFDERFFKQQYEFDEQRAAIDIWTDTNAKEHMLVIYNAESPKEKSEEAKLLTDINTNIRENVVKFIMGVRPMSEFDNFLSELEKLNLQRVIEIKQQAYDSYRSR